MPQNNDETARLEEPSVRFPKDNPPSAPEGSTQASADGSQVTSQVRPAAVTLERSHRSLSEILRPPLLPGENEADLAAVTRAIIAQMKPRDAIEQILCADAIRLVWNRMRNSRFNAALLSSRAFDCLTDRLSFKDPTGIRASWTRDEQPDRDALEAVLANFGLTRDLLFAMGLASGIDAFERMARIDLINSKRFDATLREYDWRRTILSAETSQTDAPAVSDKRESLQAPPKDSETSASDITHTEQTND